MGSMALTPETSAALDEALTAVIEECGDDPEYAELVDSLQSAKEALPEGEPAEGEEPAEPAEPAEGEGDDRDQPEAEAEEDAYSFEKAEEKHKAARKKPKKGENPFAEKGE